MDKTNLWECERELAGGLSPFCGVDEAGRGPLAGPVYAAAVMFGEGTVIEGINDSKKLSEKARERLFPIILSEALSYGIASASVEEIEELNILNATHLAMMRAIAMLSPQPLLALVDGDRFPDSSPPALCVVGGDRKCASIAAASILAKVTRDRYMLELAGKYPQYSFEKHKGYGTALHRRLIKEHGPCPEHRLAYLNNMKNW